MEIKDCKYRLRCEMGACGKRAEYTICPARVGIRSSIHICGDCLAEVIAEGKRLTGVKKTATDTAGADTAAAACGGGVLAAGGAKKAPLKRKPKKAAGAECEPIADGQLMFADAGAADAYGEAADGEPCGMNAQAGGGTTPAEVNMPAEALRPPEGLRE